MTAPLLAVDGLKYCYPGGVVALRDLNLKIRKGRKLAILGANGSGKTTLLLHLNGTFRPTHGEIRIDGQPAAYDRRSLINWRRRVGLVLQEPDDQLFAATVEQDVSFGPLNLGLSEAETRERVREALEALRMAPLAQRATHTLSFGQKKRAAIAGIVAMRPEILVLDEPTAGQDYWNYRTFMDAILQMLGFDAILFITHDVDLAVVYANRILLVFDGRLIADGPPHIVLGDIERLRTCRVLPTSLLELNMQCFPKTGRFLRAESLAQYT